LIPPAPLRLRLDGEALVSNWKWLATQSGKAACGAAVKADGYGLRAREVVARLWQAGCRDFFVAHWAEAAAISDIVPPGSIAVLNGIDQSEADFARELGAVPVLNTPKQVALWRDGGGGRCHVMLDSGINRLGIGPEQLGQGLFDRLEIDILMSHLASADEDAPQNEEQLLRFVEMSSAISCNRRSLANSAGIMLGNDYHFDLTRPGLALYGGTTRSEQKVEQVAYLEARVLQVRKLKAGEAVGYNATFRATHDMQVATLAIGYADGYWRGFSGKGSALIEGKILPVIGRVSMDLVTVDATAHRDLSEGDWVDVDFDLPSAAAVSGIAQYELLTGLSRRAVRVWF
jgi:alanine racemase